MQQTGINYLYPMTCPECECILRCEHWCSCPMCSDLSRHTTTERDRIAFWRGAAPVVNALKAEGLPWAWGFSTVTGADFFLECGDEYQITLVHDGYLTERWITAWKRSTEKPQAGQWTEAYRGDDALTAARATRGDER